MVNLTLPTDSEERKNLPVVGGCRNYFPAALAGVARWSKLGNDKHNPGQPLHHARGKSFDHEECIERHSMDLADILAAIERLDADPNAYNEERARLIDMALDEYDARCWRALAASQEFREKHGLAPLAPAARLPTAAQRNFSRDLPDRRNLCEARDVTGDYRCQLTRGHTGECSF